MALVVREARPGDEPCVAELHVRAWQEAYSELMPADFLAALDPRERASRYRFGDIDEGGPTTLIAIEVGGEGDEDDPSLTNSLDVRSGASPSASGDALLGFVTFCQSRDADATGLGEIAALYVEPGRYGGGVGRLLMAEARWRLRDEGFSEALLWVLDGNERAAQFYEREGWSRDGARREENPYEIVSNVSRFRRTLN